MLILIAGDYKTGKSVSAGTFPKPMKYFDWDIGFDSLKNTKGKDGKLVVPDLSEIDVVPFVREDISDLDFKTPVEKGGVVGSAPGFSKQASELIRLYGTEVRALESNPKKYKTLVVDSTTSMFRIWKEALLHANNIPWLRIADYGTLERNLFSVFIPQMKTLVHKGIVDYVVLVSHIMMDKDELTGAITEFPVGPSANQGRGIGKEIDNILRQVVEGGVYKWRTKKTGFFQAGSRLDLPDPITPATFQELEKYIRRV